MRQGAMLLAVLGAVVCGCDPAASASACDWSPASTKAGTWTSTGTGTGCGIYSFTVSNDDGGTPTKLGNFGTNAVASVNVAGDTVEPKAQLEILGKKFNTCHLGCIKGGDYDTRLYLSCQDAADAKCTMEYKK